MTTTPDTNELLRIYDSHDPAVDADTVLELAVSQSLGSNIVEIGLTSNDEQSKRYIKVTGPTQLDACDVVGVYPAPDSKNSTANYLPHIALRRSTLPWERAANVLPPTAPTGLSPVWLALILLSDTDSGASIDDKQVTITTKLLSELLPPITDLPLLCHMRKVPTNANEAKLDDDGKVAIVMGGMLPKPDTSYTACLVSLYSNEKAVPNQDTEIKIPLLWKWNFRTASGGDFEQIVKGLRHRGNGGVMAFGTGFNIPTKAEPKPGQPHIETVPTAAPTQILSADDSSLDIQMFAGGRAPSTVRYAGPLVAHAPNASDTIYSYWQDRVSMAIVPTAVKSTMQKLAESQPEESAQAIRDSLQDTRYQAAFELGRLLTLSNPVVLESLSESSSGGTSPHAPDKRRIHNPIDAIIQARFESRIRWPDEAFNPAEQISQLGHPLQPILAAAVGIPLSGSDLGNKLQENLKSRLDADITGIRNAMKRLPIEGMEKNTSLASVVTKLSNLCTQQKNNWQSAPLDPQTNLEDIGKIDYGSMDQRLADVRHAVESPRV